MWVRFGRDDRAKPQEYSKYFEDFATKERRSKMAADGMRDGSYSFAALSSGFRAKQ